MVIKTKRSVDKLLCHLLYNAGIAQPIQTVFPEPQQLQTPPAVTDSDST